MIFEVTLSEFNRKLFGWLMDEFDMIPVGGISLYSHNEKFKNDLGIKFLTEYYRYSNDICYRFRVTDPKKWMLAKIKYGF